MERPRAARRGRPVSIQRAALYILVAFSLVSAAMLFFLPREQPACHCPAASHVQLNASQAGAEAGGQAGAEAAGQAGGGRGLRPAYERKLHAADVPEWGRHRLAVIVPFRDRFEEMMVFVPHMHMYLNQQKVRHKFFVINQVDMFRFNRASLINAGFLQAEEQCDYLAMHDVDLLPLAPGLSYAFPEAGPFHVAAPHLHPKYHYPTFVGGILLLNNDHYRLVNGMSNQYWGWGKEDDEFYVRMQEARLKISRPGNVSSGLDTFRHIHDRRRRPRDNLRYWDQKTKSRRRDRITGLDTLQYSVASAVDMTVEGAPVTLVNVRLQCDLARSKWCLTPADLEDVRAYLSGVTPAPAPGRKATPAPDMDLGDLVLPEEWDGLVNAFKERKEKERKEKEGQGL